MGAGVGDRIRMKLREAPLAVPWRMDWPSGWVGSLTPRLIQKSRGDADDQD